MVDRIFFSVSFTPTLVPVNTLCYMAKETADVIIIMDPETGRLSWITQSNHLNP